MDSTSTGLKIKSAELRGADKLIELSGLDHPPIALLNARAEMAEQVHEQAIHVLNNNRRGSTARKLAAFILHQDPAGKRGELEELVKPCPEEGCAGEAGHEGPHRQRTDRVAR